VFAHGLASSGSAQLTASAAGYPSDTATVTLAPSGFVLYGPNGVGVQSFVVPQGTTNFELTVSPARLTSALAFAAIQPIRGGLTVMVPVDSSPTTVGTVAPSQVSFGGGTSIANLFFNAIASGAAAVTAGIPAGFMQPASNANRMNATVTPSGLVANSLSIGKDLEVPTNIRLNSPAGSSGAVVTVTSSDATKVRFSTSPTTAGTGSLTLNVEAGRNSTAIFYVQALANTGAVAYSATASGFGSANATVNLFPSGFVLQGPFGVGSNFITTTGAANSDLTVIGGRLDASLNFVEPQQIRGGLNAAVSVTSSNTAAGTITIPTVSIPAGATSGETQFDPIGQGLSTLRAVAPAGFSTPAANSSLTADVRTPALNITGGLLIGKNLQEVGSILLGQPAPPSGVVVQLTSNSGLLRLSNSPNTAGTASINVTIPGGQSSATYIIQSLGDTGTATYTATAPGYQTSTATINLSRSGIVISGLFGFGFPLIAPLNGGPQPVTVSTALLDSGNAFIATQPLAGGQTVSVSITNSNPGIGTVSSPVTITGGSDGNTGTFTPLAVGETVLGAVTPAGYTTPSNNRTVTARVTP
jgi:hypothetical protein